MILSYYKDNRVSFMFNRREHHLVSKSIEPGGEDPPLFGVAQPPRRGFEGRGFGACCAAHGGAGSRAVRAAFPDTKCWQAHGGAKRRPLTLIIISQIARPRRPCSVASGLGCAAPYRRDPLFLLQFLIRTVTQSHEIQENVAGNALADRLKGIKNGEAFC